MTAHHHSGPPHRHPHPHRFEPAWSLVRMSAWERLAGAAAIVGVLWVAIAWAMA